MQSKASDDQFSDEEIARRRDDVIRRMANTPPQPKPKKGTGASPAKKRGRVARPARAPTDLS
jgi:hypothetical protein